MFQRHASWYPLVRKKPEKKRKESRGPTLALFNIRPRPPSSSFESNHNYLSPPPLLSFPLPSLLLLPPLNVSTDFGSSLSSLAGLTSFSACHAHSRGRLTNSPPPSPGNHRNVSRVTEFRNLQQLFPGRTYPPFFFSFLPFGHLLRCQ